MGKRKRLKFGLVLGSGSAKGLVHIGVLKVLHQSKIFPDYIVGTSIGAVIGAAYAAGRTPEEIEELFQKIDWKAIVDFTLPKNGLLKGRIVETKIRNLVQNKSFEELNIPLQLVAYDLTAKKKVEFIRGDVARAVRASISIPGVFTPLSIHNHSYIDGAVVDPIPVRTVKKMGADVILVVDLVEDGKTMVAPRVEGKSLLRDWREKFIMVELQELKQLLIPRRWPKIVQKFLRWLFDILFYPARVLRMFAGIEMFPLPKLMYQTINVMSDTLAKEKLRDPAIDITLKPRFGSLNMYDFDEVEEFSRIGSEAMRKKLSVLKEKLRL